MSSVTELLWAAASITVDLFNEFVTYELWNWFSAKNRTVTSVRCSTRNTKHPVVLTPASPAGQESAASNLFHTWPWGYYTGQELLREQYQEIRSSEHGTIGTMRIGHILRRNCLLKHAIEGKLEWRIEMTGRRGRRRKQLLDDLKEKRRYWELKEDALDRTLWRTRFWRGYGPVVRQTAEWRGCGPVVRQTAEWRGYGPVVRQTTEWRGYGPVVRQTTEW
jgi:hypothetical protein